MNTDKNSVEKGEYIMLINLTNHPFCNWHSKQLEAAMRLWNSIQDFPFPDVPPDWDEKKIFLEAADIVDKIAKMNPEAVLCQGEMTMTAILVNLLQKSNFKVYAAASSRQSIEERKTDGTVEKKSVFQFVRFRQYHDFGNLSDKSFT